LIMGISTSSDPHLVESAFLRIHTHNQSLRTQSLAWLKRKMGQREYIQHPLKNFSPVSLVSVHVST
jgi:hypothetical protein